MTKEEKALEEESKPIEMRNYWHLSKEGKKLWLESHELNKVQDIIIPIVLTGLSFLLFILGIVMMCLPKPTGATVLSVFLFIFILPIIGWIFYWMITQYKGLFIFRYWRIKKPKGPANKPVQPSQPVAPKQPAPAEPIDLDLV